MFRPAAPRAPGRRLQAVVGAVSFGRRSLAAEIAAFTPPPTRQSVRSASRVVLHFWSRHGRLFQDDLPEQAPPDMRRKYPG